MSSCKRGVWLKENHRLPEACGGAEYRNREMFDWLLLASSSGAEEHQHTLIAKFSTKKTRGEKDKRLLSYLTIQTQSGHEYPYWR